MCVSKAFSRITPQVSGSLDSHLLPSCGPLVAPKPHVQPPPQATCFTLSKSDSSAELGVEGWASEVINEDDDFILRDRVRFGTETRLERACLPFQGSTLCSSLQIWQIQPLWVGGAPALIAHLGKVVLFFSQGLRTGSGGQATNSKD